MKATILVALAISQASLVSAQEAIVLARLRDAGTGTLGCGMFHFGVVMKYEVLRVLDGEHRGSLLYATHGCPEMPRTIYGGEAAGTLKQFRVGEVHRLVLWPKPPAEDVTIVDAFKTAKGRRYWVHRADEAPEDEGKGK
jgi:hypothetical protein